MRKQILYFTTFLLLATSCVPTLYQVSHHETDLQLHNENGFFITTGDYMQEYEPISILTSTCTEGYSNKPQKNQPVQKKIKVDDIYYTSQIRGKYGSWTKSTTQDLVDEMVIKAKASGANALIRLKITPIYKYSKGAIIGIGGYTATGTAIKRIK